MKWPQSTDAPSTMLPARSGTAWTEANPASAAAGTNRGHRRCFGGQIGRGHQLADGVAVQTRALISLQLEQLQFAGTLEGRQRQAGRLDFARL
jgi:hypothetical protein